jgi:hypothetical protein
MALLLPSHLNYCLLVGGNFSANWTDNDLNISPAAVGIFFLLPEWN